MLNNVLVRRLILSLFFVCSWSIGNAMVYADSKTSQAGINFTGDGTIEVNVTLTKKDIDTNQLLSGAEFELRSKNGQSVRINEKYVTDKNGQIHINRLLPGKYEFVETKSPEGYQLDSKPLLFEVNFEKTEANLIHYNKKINEEDSNKSTKKRFLPQTGEYSFNYSRN